MVECILKKNGNLMDVEVASEIKTKVPGYIITREGYFIEVPFNVLHHDFFDSFYKLYFGKNPDEKHIGYLKSELIKEGFIIYLGNLPGLRGIYSTGVMFIPKYITTEQIDAIYKLDYVKDMEFSIYEDPLEITPDFIEVPILLSDLQKYNKIFDKEDIDGIGKSENLLLDDIDHEGTKSSDEPQELLEKSSKKLIRSL